MRTPKEQHLEEIIKVYQIREFKFKEDTEILQDMITKRNNKIAEQDKFIKELTKHNEDINKAYKKLKDEAL